MMKLTALTLAVVAAATVAEDVDDVFPVAGDVGKVEICEEGSEDCQYSCVKEEEEDGTSSASACLDLCSAKGYFIQQENTTMIKNDQDEEEEYWTISVVPAESCVEGCQCPKATGLSKKRANDENDENKEELPEKYDLTFYAMDGSADAGYYAGKLEFDYEVKDDDENKQVGENHVGFSVQYFATHINENGEKKVEEEQCELRFKIAEGKVGGIDSGVAAPDVPTTPTGESIGQLTRLTSMKATCASFDEGTEDWCTYTCGQQYSVGTHGAGVTFVPQVGYVNADCKCPWGIGYQIGAGKDFDEAQVLFKQTEAEMCTYDFDHTDVNAVAKVSASSYELNITHVMSDGSECTYGYEISGVVMGKQGEPHTNENDAKSAPKGQVVMAMILTVVVIIGFCTPCFIK